MNKNSRKDFIQYLKDGHYAFKIVKGKYGSIENPAMIFNITLSAVKNLAKNFDQSSFIYIVSNEEGTEYQYYDKANDYSEPTKTEHSLNIMDNPNDFYAQISKNFKFSIPFNFDECLERVTKRISECYHKSPSLTLKCLDESVNYR